MKPLPRIRLRLLGRMAVVHGDDPVPLRLSTRKAGALLAYLAMRPEQTASREELATLLWGSCSDQQARQSLRQALASLRKDLRQPGYLIADTELVRLQPGLWSVDAHELEQLSKSTDPQELMRAARLLDGDLLSGLSLEEEGFEDWVRDQRRRMQLAAARLCETFAARPELVADGEEAIGAAERLLALDPLNEGWQRVALTLYARYRGKSEALAQATTFAALLKRELGVAPDESTRELVARIRNGELSPAAAGPAPRPDVVAALVSDPVTSRIDPPRSLPGHSALKTRVNALLTRQSIAFARRLAKRMDPRVKPGGNAGGWAGRAAAAGIAVALVAAGTLALALAYNRSGEPVPMPSQAVAQVTAANSDYWQAPSSAGPAAKDIIPIAVLPLSAIGETGASTHLIAEMMTDDLINILSRVPSFRVISRQTMSRYQGQPVDVATIGAELQVRYVLEGSIREQDGGLRVNVQLLDPATRLQVWSGRVERENTDRHLVRDEIIARIARDLQIDIQPIEGERRSADQSADASAFLGWAAMQSAFANLSTDEYKRAERHFKQALERDPQHVRALMGLGAYHSNLAVQRLDPDTTSHFEKAQEILTAVVRRDPGNASAYHHLGVLTQGQGTIDKLHEAVALFEKAVELNPSAAGSHAHIGHALARLGQPEKGIEHVRYAMRLSPRDPALPIWHEFLGNAQLETTHYQDAIDSFARSAALAPSYPRAWAGLAAAHALASDAETASADLDKLRALAPGVSAEGLIKRFGRRKESRLHAGLRLALLPSADR
jgi:DNA-binding SARP family transcriptional activator/TolB-like protein/Tfp pilus assembly protein PilF